jgi:hypothetical protein
VSSLPRRLRFRLAVREDERLSANAKLLLFVLDTYANDEGECRPSVETLCLDMGRDERTLRRARDEAVDLGYLVITKRGGGRRIRNEYRLQLPSETPAGTPGFVDAPSHAETPAGVQINPGSNAGGTSQRTSHPVPVAPTHLRRRKSASNNYLDDDALTALADLVEALDDADAQTATTFLANFDDLSAEDFAYAHGVVERRRVLHGFVDDVKPVESEARFAFGVLSNLQTQRPLRGSEVA